MASGRHRSGRPGKSLATVDLDRGVPRLSKKKGIKKQQKVNQSPRKKCLQSVLLSDRKLAHRTSRAQVYADTLFFLCYACKIRDTRHGWRDTWLYGFLWFLLKNRGPGDDDTKHKETTGTRGAERSFADDFTDGTRAGVDYVGGGDNCTRAARHVEATRRSACTMADHSAGDEGPMRPLALYA